MMLHAVAHQLFASRRCRAAALRRARLILGLVVLPFLACTSIARSEESSTSKIVYSEDQALKGRDLYDEHCAACHGATLEGPGSLPLSGATFRARWADDRHSVDDLSYIIRTLLPYGAQQEGGSTNLAEEPMGGRQVEQRIGDSLTQRLIG
jgi:mono/diheme cytochrome c family protein